MAAEDIEKLARETSAAQYKGSSDPGGVAVAVAREIVAAARAGKLQGGPSVAFTAATAGVLSSLMLAEGDLVAVSLKVLRELPDVSSTQDPMKTMVGIMEGIAKVAALAGPAQRDEIEARIDAEFHGAGAVFKDLCLKRQGAA